MRFFDRERELADLREIRERSREVAQFTVVTGRRRVGKTSLVVKGNTASTSRSSVRLRAARRRETRSSRRLGGKWVDISRGLRMTMR